MINVITIDSSGLIIGCKTFRNGLINTIEAENYFLDQIKNATDFPPPSVELLNEEFFEIPYEGGSIQLVRSD